MLRTSAGTKQQLQFFADKALPPLGCNVKATFYDEDSSSARMKYSPPLMRLRVQQQQQPRRHIFKNNNSNNNNNNKNNKNNAATLSPPLGVRELFYAPRFDVFEETTSGEPTRLPPHILYKNILHELHHERQLYIKGANPIQKMMMSRIHGNAHTASPRFDNRHPLPAQLPTFNLIQRQIVDYFRIVDSTRDTNSTAPSLRRISSRINLYSDDDYKLAHHDAHAFADRDGRHDGVEKLQNFTAVFNLLPHPDDDDDEHEAEATKNARRTLFFQEGGLLKRLSQGLDPNSEHEPPTLPHHQGGSIGVPLDNGSLVGFGRELNILWRHGVLPLASTSSSPLPDTTVDPISSCTRISIAVMGWIDQVEEQEEYRK